ELDGDILDVLAGAARFIDLRAGLIQEVGDFVHAVVDTLGGGATGRAGSGLGRLFDQVGEELDLNPVFVLIVGAFTRNTVDFQEGIKSHYVLLRLKNMEEVLPKQCPAPCQRLIADRRVRRGSVNLPAEAARQPNAGKW